MTPKDVATSRFGGDTYSPETSVDFQAMDERTEADEIANALLSQTGSVNDTASVDGYRLTTDDDDNARCSVCRHSGGTPVCTLHGFAFDLGHVCDSFDGRRPVKLRRHRGRNA